MVNPPLILDFGRTAIMMSSSDRANRTIAVKPLARAQTDTLSLRQNGKIEVDETYGVAAEEGV